MKKIIFLILVLLVLPSISANTFGAKAFGCGIFGIGCSDAVAEVSTGGGGGGSSSVRQFDIKILDFESPINLGDDFNFMYFVKGVGDFNTDITIDFWVEKEGEIITSGSDVVFMGANEEKTEAASLFMPNDVESGDYKFVIKVSHGSIKAEAHRTIELTIEDGKAVISSLFDIRFILEETFLESSNEISAIAFFENFGTDPTWVNLTFTIVDGRGRLVHTEEDSLLVETERVLRKSFEDLDLDSGKYTIILETLYGDNVRDEFEQDFEIEKEVKKINWCIKIVAETLILLIILLILWFVIKKIIKKKKKHISKKVKVFKKPMSERRKNKTKKSRKSIHHKIKKEVGNL